MRKASRKFFDDLIKTPSPSGYEYPVQAVVRKYAESFADEVHTDVHGSVIAVKNPDAPVRVMLAGHCDQIGMLIQYVEDSGMLRCAAIGGVDPTVIIASVVTVHTASGPINGVIGRKPIHLLSAEQRKNEKHDVEGLWIDIGVKDKKAAEKLVEIGDPVTFPLRSLPLQGDLIAATGCDDKVGVYAVMEALRRLAKADLKCAVYAVSTVQEELGLRGARTSAFGIDPHVGIAVDVTHATDYPGVDPKRVGEVKLGKGPAVARGGNINPVLREIIVKAAKEKKIAFQTEPAPRATGTDANAIQINRAGVAAALISVPNRYMHSSVEVISLADLENVAKLVAETVLRIDETCDFTPR